MVGLKKKGVVTHMKKINIKKCLLLIGAFFIGSLVTSYFLSDNFELVAALAGTGVFALFIFIAEFFFENKKENT